MPRYGSISDATYPHFGQPCLNCDYDFYASRSINKAIVIISVRIVLCVYSSYLPYTTIINV